MAILEREVKDFFEKNKYNYSNAEDFCLGFNILENDTAYIIPYAGRLYSCQLSYTDGPLIHDSANGNVITKVFGVYLRPCNMPDRCQLG